MKLALSSSAHRAVNPTSTLPLLLLTLGLLSGCQVISPLVPPPLAGAPMGGSDTSDNRAPEPDVARLMRTSPIPTPPLASAPAKPIEPPAASPRISEATPAVLNLEQVTLPTFIHVAFAEVLKKSVQIDPQVLARRDLVTFRSGLGQTAAQIEAATRLVLKSYGLAAIDVGDVVRVLPDNANLGYLPEIRRGTAMPDTPLPLRPIFNMVELQSVRQTDVTNWLRTLFGERIKIQEDASRNALVISGTPDNVKAALEAIVVLDQPLMSGRASVAITPAYWSADELARRLAELLGAQGYAVHPVGQPFTPGAVRFPVVLVPVAALNAVYVFVGSDALMKHVVALAGTLDKPNDRGVGKNFFTYAVQHKDADVLAQTIEQLLSGLRPGAASTTSASPTGAAAATGATSATRNLGARVVVDKSTNMLIIQASADEFNQIDSLLRMLDRPSRAALIEVTVAEMSVDDSAQLGVEWQFNRTLSDGATSSGGTVGGLGLASGGFNYRILNPAGNVRLAINALASDNRATILSSPRLLARNGESATIQVGQEVPIVTSVQSTAATNTSNSVLQTIQYRSTGVILKVKPIIHSGDQIDLDVAQEVSSAVSTTTGVSSSPTFSTRKLDTKLSLRNGATVLLGGLISSTNSDGSAGVPGLKDLPVIGSLFSNQTRGGGKRELIVLITPYIINDAHDSEAMTEAFRKMLGPWAGTATKPADAPNSSLRLLLPLTPATSGQPAR